MFLRSTYNFNKNWLKGNPFRLLPGGRIGLCLADDNLSAHRDSIQGRPGIELFIARSRFFFIPWENTKRKFGYLAVALELALYATSLLLKKTKREVLNA